MGATWAAERFYALFGGEEKLFINKVRFKDDDDDNDDHYYYHYYYIIKESAQVQL